MNARDGVKSLHCPRCGARVARVPWHELSECPRCRAHARLAVPLLRADSRPLLQVPAPRRGERDRVHSGAGVH